MARSISINWETYYAPSNNQTGTILLRKWVVKTLLGRTSISELRQSVRAFNSGFSIDAAPGGYFDAPDQVYQEANKPFKFLGIRVLDQNIGTHQKTASFIPTKSALAYHWNTDQLAGDLGENLSDRNLVCTGEIPFNDYFQPPAQMDANTEHVHLSAETANYILSLLNPVAPPPIAYTVVVNGPGAVQTGSKTIFTAQYQGNFQFITLWSITEKQGISANLTTNSLGPDCSVLVGNGNGNSTDGYFILKAQTMVRLPTGEVICAGQTIKKVFVRKIPNTGNIEQGCDLVKENYTLNFRSMLPDLNPLGNGTQYVRNDWQISRYNEEGSFGNQAYQSGTFWHFSLYPSYPYQASPYWYSKASVNFNGGLSNGTQGILYVRTRPVFKMTNPDNPNEILEVFGAWKSKAAQFTVTENDPVCLFRPAVGPDPAVKDVNQTVQITEEFGNDFTFPIEGVVLDSRGDVVEKFEASKEPILVSISGLEPAEYSVRFTDGNGNAFEKSFSIQAMAGSHLTISPNPAVKELDEWVNLKIMDPSNEDQEFLVEVRDFEGQLKLDFTAGSREFDLPVQDLDIGNYVVTVKGNNSFYQEEVSLGLKGTPYLVLIPNPVSDVLHAEVLNPQAENGEFKILITDKLGNVMKEEALTTSKFDLDVHDLAPDLYYLKFWDGNQHLGKIFRKL